MTKPTFEMFRNLRILRNGGTLERKVGSERPKFLKPNQVRSLAQIALYNEVPSSGECSFLLAERHNVAHSKVTTWRSLKKSGITKKITPKNAQPDFSP